MGFAMQAGYGVFFRMGARMPDRASFPVAVLLLLPVLLLPPALIPGCCNADGRRFRVLEAMRLQDGIRLGDSRFRQGNETGFRQREWLWQPAKVENKIE